MFNIEKFEEDDRWVCHSGGAKGADTIFEELSILNGVDVRAYTYKTKYHNSPNKFEISEIDFQEGILEIELANSKILKRNKFNIQKYINLLARNWAQVKYSDEIFAVSNIIEPGGVDDKGYVSKSKIQVVSGGTGWACAMAVNNRKDLYVFNQSDGFWYKWSYISQSFRKCASPKITKKNFAGIGSRNINRFGVDSIKKLFEDTFK